MKQRLVVPNPGLVPVRVTCESAKAGARTRSVVDPVKATTRVAPHGDTASSGVSLSPSSLFTVASQTGAPSGATTRTVITRGLRLTAGHGQAKRKGRRRCVPLDHGDSPLPRYATLHPPPPRHPVLSGTTRKSMVEYPGADTFTLCGEHAGTSHSAEHALVKKSRLPPATDAEQTGSSVTPSRTIRRTSVHPTSSHPSPHPGAEGPVIAMNTGSNTARVGVFIESW